MSQKDGIIKGCQVLEAPDKAQSLLGATVTSHQEDYRIIPLTQGQVTKVSAHRYEYLSQWKWHAQWSRCTKSFYAYRRSSRKDGPQYNISMARVVLGLERSDKRVADHRNGDTLNNCDDNVRIATRRQNQINQKRAANRKYPKGVHRLADDRYQARIKWDGKVRNLGVCATPEEAHTLYCLAAVEVHGEFARFE